MDVDDDIVIITTLNLINQNKNSFLLGDVGGPQNLKKYKGIHLNRAISLSEPSKEVLMPLDALFMRLSVPPEQTDFCSSLEWLQNKQQNMIIESRKEYRRLRSEIQISIFQR